VDHCRVPALRRAACFDRAATSYRINVATDHDVRLEEPF
jgi:hypothetical protein